MNQTSDPSLPMAVISFGLLMILIYNGLALRSKIRELAEVFKKVIRPNYPITADDLMEARQAVLASNPAKQLEFSVSTLLNIIKMVWRRYPKNKTLDSKAKEVRSIIYRTILLLIAGFIALCAVVFMSFS